MITILVLVTLSLIFWFRKIKEYVSKPELNQGFKKRAGRFFKLLYDQSIYFGILASVIIILVSILAKHK